MSRYRVAHVITRLCTGGAQENTFHTVRLADRTRFEPDLIAGPTSGSEGSIEELVRAAGIEVTRIPGLVRNVSPLNDWRALHALERLFRERRYHIVHTHTSKAGYLGRMAAARAGVPVVVHTPHGHIFDGYFPSPVTWLFTLLERRAARHTDRLVALTARGIGDHLRQGIGRPDQWLAIFSGIDFEPFDAAIARREQTRAALGIGQEEVLVGAVGRLEPVKGFAYFVEAMHAVAYAVPEARFVLVGDGSQERKLRRQALNMGPRMHFLGLRRDVPDLMAAMDVLVLPSVNEGMGRVVLEAGAAGIPVVATRVGGVPDIVADGITGLLVPPRAPAAIARAVVELALDPARRQSMGAAARAFVVPDHGLGAMVRQIEALYNRILEEKHIDP
jgi:glycosyltransferase involved in cell wall biosynthesis